eukprot:99594-Rhodomonas_salina.2
MVEGQRPGVLPLHVLLEVVVVPEAQPAVLAHKPLRLPPRILALPAHSLLSACTIAFSPSCSSPLSSSSVDIFRELAQTRGSPLKKRGLTTWGLLVGAAGASAKSSVGSHCSRATCPSLSTSPPVLNPCSCSRCSAASARSLCLSSAQRTCLGCEDGRARRKKGHR